MNTCGLEVAYVDERYATAITEAERECTAYLKGHSAFQGRRALDVGVGASHFYQELHSFYGRVDGITVVDSEIEVSRGLPKSSCMYYVVKQNKYDIDGLSNSFSSVLTPSYNAIVDVNLKMFACCEDHWKEYFYYIINCVTPGGVLLTHTAGFPGSKRIGSLTLDELGHLIAESGKDFLIETVPSTLMHNKHIVIMRRDND